MFQRMGIGKGLLKDVKDKEKREKDFKEKEKEVTKDKREKDKDQKELEIAQARSTDERIAQLEETVAMLAHFIGATDRPDLQHSALGEETDLGRQLQQQATDAKALKDDKDLEKGRES